MEIRIDCCFVWRIVLFYDFRPAQRRSEVQSAVVALSDGGRNLSGSGTVTDVIELCRLALKLVIEAGIRPIAYSNEHCIRGTSEV